MKLILARLWYVLLPVTRPLGAIVLWIALARLVLCFCPMSGDPVRWVEALVLVLAAAAIASFIWLVVWLVWMDICKRWEESA